MNWRTLEPFSFPWRSNPKAAANPSLLPFFRIILASVDLLLVDCLIWSLRRGTMACLHSRILLSPKQFTRRVLRMKLRSLFTSYVMSMAMDSWKEFLKEVDGRSENSMSLVDFRNWCKHIPSARKYLGCLLNKPDTVRPGFQVPHLLLPENLSLEALILQKEHAWHIAGALSQMEAEEWKLVYHSAINVLSFSTFMGNLSNIDGRTILVIKDIDGYIYGGYASLPWERHNDFYGDMKSFLFQLYPHASIYRPTGLNNNLQWCALNFSSESIPNGIGFGGRANHFGLFLSANFDRGHSFACTTFDSPCLSKTNLIQPSVIECWAVLNKGFNSEVNELVKGTVLERFKEDHNMLKMVGLANSSE